MEKESTSVPRRRGGRGARERILEAAAALFYEEGINATGIARLVETAEVSTRTFYQHFPTKTALVEEYLRRYEAGLARRVEERLAPEGLSPRDQLLAQFVMVAETASRGAGGTSNRGCPLHNAAVEAAGTMPRVRELVQRNREGVVQQFTDIATRAGAADPERLGRQLAVLLEGANAMSTSLDSSCPRQDALDAARVLIEHFLPDAQPVN
ncbi:TetR/AcrR family transcriptional regulator [Streptomyces sp. NPDC007157]|uniref:TetR/AcrR family transcriptional regulator n=1 Tax=Streptomyces sp. NPDC007157 TaxID=3154681 RepID=UPI0033E0CDFF